MRDFPGGGQTRRDKAEAGVRWVVSVFTLRPLTYVLLTDETNQQPSESARFFIYGGVFFPATALPQLDELVRDAREEAGYRRSDVLKFDTRSRPEQVTRQQHTAAKRRLLESCADLDVRFVAYLVLHDIARNRSLEQLVRWGVNTVLSTFQRFLEREGEARSTNLR